MVRLYRPLSLSRSILRLIYRMEKYLAMGLLPRIHSFGDMLAPSPRLRRRDVLRSSDLE